ncbi:aminotransferase class I/II-fold pyridoxal phosphate-dependent enzyme [Streptomyces sp. CT34]|uniref:aminotransferase class I/II-fold pyridoxal phosphate-dependent enzyme n=1 Tax=Streptomyces sp. CT34 TaxID=1553907 RepID=UPI0005BA1472|nr:aminotransferase class I/II-fold pyridoxal phosphate-dependent enzyme [Streptomyces sp. CT34]
MTPFETAPPAPAPAQYADNPRRHSKKWQECPPGGIPLDLADMDFPTDPAVTDTVRRRLRHPLGYPPHYTTNGTAQTICDYYAAHHGLTLAPADVWLTSSCVAAAYLLFDQLLCPGDEVLYFSPSYHFIPDAIAAAGGRPVGVPLRPDGTLDQSVAARLTKRTRAFHLCNPHNPTGYAFTCEELRQLARLAREHDLSIISNELHSRLILEGDHTPIAALGEDARARTITLSGPTKSHNLSGLGVAFALTPAEGPLKDAIRRIGPRMTVPKGVQQAALTAAYAEDSPWLRGTRAYLRGNRDTMVRILRDLAPTVRVRPPRATYFLWLDLRRLRLREDAAGLIERRTGVRLLSGREFGSDGRHWARMTFATDRGLLEEAVHRIASGAL